MAHRDRSQGFAFVYVDVAKLLRERDQIANHAGEVQPAPVSPNVNFPKAEQTAEMPRPDADQVKENLDRLQSLHHKLHAMLSELDRLTGGKKRNS